jgi:hypothetical protein
MCAATLAKQVPSALCMQSPWVQAPAVLLSHDRLQLALRAMHTLPHRRTAPVRASAPPSSVNINCEHQLRTSSGTAGADTPADAKGAHALQAGLADVLCAREAGRHGRGTAARVHNPRVSLACQAHR